MRGVSVGSYLDPSSPPEVNRCMRTVGIDGGLGMSAQVRELEEDEEDVFVRNGLS
jgi:hypothetical protein